MQKIKNRPAVYLVLLLFLASCGKDVVVDGNREFGTQGWPVSEKITLDFEQQDTVSKYNFYITVRNTAEYPYRNLYVFLTTEYPDGSKQRDTVNCPLADYRGKWLGRGFGGVFDNRILYMAKARFRKPGEFKIRMEQAMRTDTLPGILSAGIRIEKAE